MGNESGVMLPVDGDDDDLRVHEGMGYAKAVDARAEVAIAKRFELSSKSRGPMMWLSISGNSGETAKVRARGGVD